MNTVSTIADLEPQDIWDMTCEIAGDTVEKTINMFMEAERDEYVQCAAYQRNRDRVDYRNGYYTRSLTTKFGEISLRVPRTRSGRFRSKVFERYRRRVHEVDEAVIDWVAGGGTTRSVERMFERCFGALVSATTVSRIIARVDEELFAFHRRRFRKGYRILWLDAEYGRIHGEGTGVLLSAWGLRWDGCEELVDFRACRGEESLEAWTRFLSDLEARGLRKVDEHGNRLELIVVDGHGGLESALRTVYPRVPVQRCVFHKIRNIVDHLRDRSHRKAILCGASRIYRTTRREEAEAQMRKWAAKWVGLEPEAVKAFLSDFDATLTYLSLPTVVHPRARTTNPLERLHAEMEKAWGHVPMWRHALSWERRTFLLWRRLLRAGYAPTKPRFDFTQES